MIETSLSRVKIHEVIQSQIPEYIDFENPLFGEFLKQYYYSQEFQGGPVDIAENLTEYKSLDFLNTETLTGFTSLTSYIDGQATTIYVDSTQGFPNQWGLFKINDEIITYTGIGSTSFTGCVRGFSGIEKNAKTNEPEHLTFTISGVGTHGAEARVTNLSNVFLNEFLKKLKTQILPGFQERVLNGNLDQSNFIRQAKDFYKSKGTEEAFKILFGALYDKKVEMVQPQEFLFRPSDADFVVNDVVVCEVISGDPTKIVSQTLSQGDAGASIYDVESIVLNNRTYYKIRLSTDTLVGKFVPTNRTYATRGIGVGATVLYVDSTVGYAKSASLTYDSQTVEYTDKTLTEFLNVTGVTAAIGIGQTLNQGNVAVSYEDGDINAPVRLRVLNSVTAFDGSGVIQDSGTQIQIKTLGKKQEDLKFHSWIQNSAVKHTIDTFSLIGPNSYRITLLDESFYNNTDLIDIVDEDGNVMDGSVTNIIGLRTLDINCPTLTPGATYFIRAKLRTNKEFVANVQNTYSGDSSIFVASNSLPHYDIDPQKRVRSFTVTGDTITVPDHNYVSGEIVIFTGSAVGLNTDQPYYVKRLNGNQFKLALSAENARRDQVITIDGSGSLTPFQVGLKDIGAQQLLRKFEDPTLGNKKDVVEPGGVGLFLNGVEIQSHKSSDRVYYGSINDVSVLNTGAGYDVINPPRLSVQQSGHTGAGSSVVAQVAGPIVEFLVDTEGLDYTSKPDVKITGGNGQCSADAKMKSVSHEVEFDSSTVGGIVNTSTNKFVFKTAHGFKSGEEVIYSTDGTTTIGIGTTPGNLVNQSTYRVVKNDDYTISLARTQGEAVLGVGTIPLTSSGAGIHKFSTKIPRLKVDKVNVISSTDFFNREVTIQETNEFIDVITAKNHRYSSGDKVRFTGSVAGLTSGDDYYVIKVNEDQFRVSISTSLTSFVNLTTSSGTGSFNYPPIVVEIKGQQGISTADATATPIVRGVVDGVNVVTSGADFGSLVINDNFKPDVRVITGSQASLVPVIVNGQIDSVSVKAGGKDFFSVPDIIINGDGIGARLKARISGGKIVGVDVINKGINYTRTGTTISAKTPGEGLISSANLKEWTINNVHRYAKFGDVADDDGYFGNLKVEKNNLPYINYYASRKLREYLGDDGVEHSPILGYAYDGHPIYGPYALVDDVLKYVESSYDTVGGSRPGGPPVADYAKGFFVEDFVYQEGLGDLDEHNGRFAATPEYPNGVYAYYVTESSTVVTNSNSPFANRREPLFPYVVGNSFHAEVQDYNLQFTSTQDKLPAGLVRNTKKQNIREYEFVGENAKGKFTPCVIESTSKGSVKSVSVLESGKNYNVGDTLAFNSTGTGGFGALGRVTDVVGAAVTVITSTIETNENVELFAEGNIVTGIVTVGVHSYVPGIPLKVSGISSSIYSELEGTFIIDVPFVKSGLGTSLLATGLTTNIRLTENVAKFQENDILQVDDEQMKVLIVDTLNQKIKLARAQNNTVGAAHTNRAEIRRLEQKFTYRTKKPVSVDTPKNITEYFDAENSVGVGLTAGVGIGTTVSFIGAGNSTVNINLPIKAIRIPNHRFVHGDRVSYTPGGGSFLLYSFDGANTHFLPANNLFVQKISKDLIGIVTQASQIANVHDRVYFNGTIGIGDTHSFRTQRPVAKANVTKFETVVSTASTHNLEIGDVIDLTLVSAGTSTLNMEYDAATKLVSIGSSANPPVFVTVGDKLVFDTSDIDLADTEIRFYEDPNFVKRFVGTGSSTIEITSNLVAGIASATTTVHFTEQMPSVLYYKFVSLNANKQVEVNTDVKDFGKIIVNPSAFSGRHSISTATAQEFRYVTPGAPERVGYTSESVIQYTTKSKNVTGGVHRVLVEEGGRNYKTLPKVAVASTTGSSAVLSVQSDSIGNITKTRILEFGYDFPSDETLRPEASVPDVIVLRDNFSLESIGITSTGSNYLTAPDLIVYNETIDKINDSVNLIATLKGTSVNDVRIVSGGGNLTSFDNRILAVNNTNGVGIITATYSDPTVTLRLQTPPTGFTTAVPLPFAVGDEVFVENLGVTTGNGYNSADHKYKFFSVTGVNTNPGLVNQATITFEVDKEPGLHDGLTFGIVTKKQNVAQFEATLTEGVFFAGEEVYTESTTTNIVAGKDSSTNIIRVKSISGIHTGDKITGKESGASGIVNSLVENEGKFTLGAALEKQYGWEKDTGKPNEFLQRVQDNDYYQRFAYSLRSQVGISSWGEPVDSLAHIAGFKKHSDLQVASTSSVNTGVGVSVAEQAASSIIIIDNEADVNCKYDWDAVRELTSADQTKSDKIVFRGNQFGEALICNTNRVLEIDDISPQFYSDPDINKSVQLDVFEASNVNAVKYHAQIVLDSTAGVLVNETQYCEFVVSHNGNVALISQYADLSDSFDLGDFTADLSGGSVSVSFNPYNPTFVYDITFYKEVIEDGVGTGTTSYKNIEKTGVSSYCTTNTAQVIQAWDANDFRSGHVLVSVASTDEKEVLEATFVGVGTTMFYNEYNKFQEDMDLGTFEMDITASQEIQVKFTPAAGLGVTVSTLATKVGIATTVGSIEGLYTIGDAALSATRTAISSDSSATPGAVTISDTTYNNYTSVKYYVEINNITNNEYSIFQVAANLYEGDANYSKFGNVSTAATERRDIINTVVSISDPNVYLQFTPKQNTAYEVRVHEVRIDKPDDVNDDTLINLP